MLETYRNFFEPLSYLDLALWIIIIFISFLIVIYTLNKLLTDSKEIRSLQRLNIITWILFFFLIGVAGILNLIWRYLISDDIFADYFDNITYLLFEISFFMKIVFTEYSINQYRFYKGYYFSVIFIVLIVFTTIIFPEPVGEIELLDIIYIILFILGVLLFPLIFVYIAIKVKGNERKMALKISFGYILLIIGILFQPQNLEIFKPFITNYGQFLNIFLILCPILLLVGILIMFNSYRKIFQPAL